MKFAEKLRNLRQEKGLSQAEVAKAIGITVRAYGSYEKNTYPRDRSIYGKLAELLDCDINYLLTEDESFVAEAAARYGSRGKKQAERLVEGIAGLFAGGDLADEDKDEMMRAIQDAYWDAKERNKQRFTRNDYREKQK